MADLHNKSSLRHDSGDWLEKVISKLVTTEFLGYKLLSQILLSLLSQALLISKNLCTISALIS